MCRWTICRSGRDIFRFAVLVFGFSDLLIEKLKSLTFEQDWHSRLDLTRLEKTTINEQIRSGDLMPDADQMTQINMYNVNNETCLRSHYNRSTP